MNELLWVGMLLANFGAILLAYRLYGRLGLYIWIPIAVIVANIQVLKAVTLFGMNATLGNIVYATSFLVTDILAENYGHKEANRAVGIGFFALLTMTVLMNLALRFTPSDADFAQDSLSTIFGFMPRLAVASLTAYLVSQYHDIWAFLFWKRRKPGTRYLWLRNNASTIVSQAIDSVIFCLVAFLGVFPLTEVIQLLLTTYLIKFIVAAADTPFIYLARKLKAPDLN